jgi:hypothetical protein
MLYFFYWLVGHNVLLLLLIWAVITVISSCSSSGTRRVNLVTSPVKSHEWGKEPGSVYDMWNISDYFNFSIVNCPFICSNIPAAPAYRVSISQLIRYSRACGYQDFVDRGLLLTRKLLNQGFLLVKLNSSPRKFYGHHHDLVTFQQLTWKLLNQGFLLVMLKSSESVNRRRIDNIMTKRKSTKTSSTDWSFMMLYFFYWLVGHNVLLLLLIWAVITVIFPADWSVITVYFFYWLVSHSALLHLLIDQS